MKKILILVTVALMSISTVYAGKGYGGKGHGLRHANPLPNLMRVAMGNAELLNLSKKQMLALRAWGSENKPKMMMLVKQVLQQEMMLREEALTTDKNVVKKAEKMLDTRRKIIAMKTACRVRLKSILNKQQYAQVISIYRSMH